MIDLTPAQAAPRIAAMLAAHESRTLEFKRMCENKAVKKLLETVCAFANTDGGILCLGVADEKQEQGSARLYGVEENPEALDEFTRKVRTQFHPPIETINFTRLPCTLRNGKAAHVVMARIPRSNKVHFIVDGTLDAAIPSQRNLPSSRVYYLRPLVADSFVSHLDACQY